MSSRLVDVHPHIAAEWHPTRNDGIELSHVAAYSNKKVWWLHVDERGDLHEWQQIIRNRSIEGTGCARCRKRDRSKPVAPFQPARPGQSLGDRFPHASVHWNEARNGDLTPFDVRPRSSRHVWWTSDCGHEWVRRVQYQLAMLADPQRSAICPICPRTFPNSVPLSQRPLLMAEWHPSRNAGIDPNGLSSGSAVKVWWFRDECGHSWKASVKSRACDDSGCPRCHRVGAGHRFGAWKTSQSPTLADKAPQIAAEWHPTKNDNLTPADVSYGSARRVWWRCPVGHEWENTVNSRTGRNRGCWCCVNASRVPVVENVDIGRSLATVDPGVAAQWHPSRNGLVTPETISARSEQKAWWQCADGHMWTSRVASRAGSDHGCRACANTADRARRAVA